MTQIPLIGDVLYNESAVLAPRLPEPEPEPLPSGPTSDTVYPDDYNPPDQDPKTWLDGVIAEAMRRDASDLLLKSYHDNTVLTAEIRVDGLMRPLRRLDGEGARVVLGKFKTESKLATGGDFKPQEAIRLIEVDGEMRKGRVVIFRVADGGDAIVIRLPPKGQPKRLSELHLSTDNLAHIENLLSQSGKMVILAGPMGEGKTTLAHAALLHVGTGTQTVWSVEDPVERTLPGLIQLEVDEKNGAGFEALLPSLVRADYNTLFLGEIRDKATAAAGVRQAKAGRQVVTTIHANDNITAILRLIELAEDSPLSVMDAVRCVISQRLVGRLNPHWDRKALIDKYKGRAPINEILLVTDELTESVMSNAPLSEIKRIAASNSVTTFAQDAKRLVEAGVTDDEEIRRVFGE